MILTLRNGAYYSIRLIYGVVMTRLKQSTGYDRTGRLMKIQIMKLLAECYLRGDGTTAKAGSEKVKRSCRYCNSH